MQHYNKYCTKHCSMKNLTQKYKKYISKHLPVSYDSPLSDTWNENVSQYFAHLVASKCTH